MAEKTNVLSEIVVVKQVSVYGHNTPHPERTVNEMLGDGWVLLSVTANFSGDSSSETLYVLGHTDKEKLAHEIKAYQKADAEQRALTEWVRQKREEGKIP